MELTKEKLIKTEKAFYEKVKSSTDKEHIIKRYDDYYKYLLEKDNESQTDEVHSLMKKQNFQLIYNFIQWCEENGVIAKDHSKEWNKGLIARVGEICSELKELKKGITEMQASLKIKLHYMGRDLLNCRDLLTASYCWSMLQRTIGPSFIPLCISLEEEKKEPEQVGKTIIRQGFGNRKIEDKREKYWHVDAKEFMTYDECTERGLGHHLLCYPIGHDCQNLYVGFKETDPSKVQTDFDDKTKEFFDTVFVTEETIAD